MNFFATPNSKNIIATLHIVTIEKSELTLLLVLYFHSMNNLYGWGLSEYLPYGRFKWFKNVDEIDVKSISEKSLIEYILEADLEYPGELHDSHNDYPLTPEQLAVSYEMLSDYCKETADKYEIKVSDVKKTNPKFGQQN